MPPVQRHSKAKDHRASIRSAEPFIIILLTLAITATIDYSFIIPVFHTVPAPRRTSPTSDYHVSAPHVASTSAAATEAASERRVTHPPGNPIPDIPFHQKPSISSLTRECTPCPAPVCPRCPRERPCAQFDAASSSPHALKLTRTGRHESLADVERVGVVTHPLKIFVYDVPEYNTALFEKTNCRPKKEFFTEREMLRLLMRTDGVHRTTDGDEADLFFVPVYHKCLVSQNHYHFDIITKLYEDLVTKIRTEYPFFNRTQGLDHVFLFSSGSGPATFTTWRKEVPKSMFLTPEASWTKNWEHASPYYDPWKDVVMPGYVDPYNIGQLRNQSKPMKDREVLVTYHGRSSHKSYGRDMLKGFGAPYKEDPTVDIGKSTKTERFYAIVGNSKFCLVPEGYSSWTIRLFESLIAGCVPVVLSDKVRFPFENEIDWTQIVIKYPEANFPDSLIDHLRKYTLEDLEGYERRINSTVPLLIWPERPTPNSAFSMVLRELSRRVRVTKNGDNSFWSKPGQLYTFKNYVVEEEYQRKLLMRGMDLSTVVGDDDVTLTVTNER